MKRKKILSKSRSRRMFVQQKRIVRARQPYHKRILLHPVYIFFLLCTGVLLLGITFRATAIDITVTGQKLAPLPTAPAVIQHVTPIDENGVSGPTFNVGDSLATIQLHQQTIILDGICPKDTYIKFYRNDIFAGTTMCIGNSTFSIEIGLYKGLNAIVADVFSLTDGEGPASLPLYIQFGEKPSSIPTRGQVPLFEPFFLTIDFQFHGVYVYEPLNWDVVIHSGLSPYAFTVNWGDNTNTTFTTQVLGVVTLTHVYKSPGGYNGSYAIKIHAKDSKSATTTLQLMAIVNQRPTKSNPVAAVTCSTSGATNRCASWLNSVKQWLWVAWPAYGIVLLMTASFWLGEREEILRFIRGRRSIHR